MRSAEAFVARLTELRKAGLSTKAGFLVLQSFSQGHVTHLLRANYESSGWPKQFDEVLVKGVELLAGSQLDASQRARVSCGLPMAALASRQPRWPLKLRTLPAVRSP